MPCENELPPEVLKGIRLFNRRRFFEAHEALETAWRAERGTTRYLYQGILQLGVGYYHLLKGNYIGAIHLFASAQKTLGTLPFYCQGIDVNQIRNQVKETALLVKSFVRHPATQSHFPISQIDIGQVNHVQRK